MTQLLISVKNTAEALIALKAGVDIIDLKDPNVGALGALNLHETVRIVQAMDGLAVLSATVGEQHVTLNDLVCDIVARAEIGVDVIKIGVSELFHDDNFLLEMAKLTTVDIKIVAVFFADEALDLSLLPKLQKAGFFGAMLDTKNKQKNLLQVQTRINLQNFTQACEQHHLKSGLAGSLRLQHIGELLNYNATYIGFRGGVCENVVRKSALSRDKVTEINDVLRQHNKNKEKPQLILRLALHS